MAEIRDKGAVPLRSADVKVRGGIDQRGYVFAVFLDFAHHEAVVWYQPLGWLPVQPYGNVNLVDFDAYPHDGHFKVLGHTWKENGGSVEGDHFIVIDLGEIPA